MLQNSTTELVFIDSSIANAETLAAAVPAGSEVVWLTGASDPWQQMTDALSGRTGVTAIHLISHGNSGEISIGGSNYQADDLLARSGLLNSWQSHLADGADFLLYGCNIGNGGSGAEFIQQLSQLTGTNVAASTDLTGATALGGDWDLETATGTVETTPLAFATSGWQGTLPTNPTYNAAYNPLVFDNYTVETGTAGADGSVVRYNNVITVDGQAIDAVMSVTLVGGISIPVFDIPASLGSSTVSPGNFELSMDAQSAPNSYGVFTINFYQHGTTVPVVLRNITINSYDIDQNQFQEFKGFDSYQLGAPTGSLIVTPSVQADGSVRFQSNVFSNSNTNVTADPARVKVYYDSISTFQLKAGMGNGATNGLPFFSLDFSQGPAWVVEPGLISTPAPKVNYSTTSFTEAVANDGSVSTVATLTLTGSFGGSAEQFVSDGSGGILGAAISNVPAGLTAVLHYVDPTHASLSFTGNATSHANADDISNVTVSFANSSFSTGNAGAVTGSSRADIAIDYLTGIAITSPTVTEGQALVYTVTLDPSASIRVLPLSLSGTADSSDYGSLSFTNGVTYDSNSGLITVPASVSTFDVTIPTNNDTLSELNETAILTIDGSVNSVGTILDNDPISLSVSSVTVSEASLYAVVQVSLSHASSTEDVSFTPTLSNGTGTVGVDTGSGLQYFDGTNWVSAGSGVVIPAGSTSVLLRASITNDSTYEGPETVTISTGAITSTGTGFSTTPASGVVTIVDDGSSPNVFNAGTNSPTPVAGTADDDRPLAITNPSVNEASPFAVFTVTSYSGSQTVSLALADSSAVGGGTDYGSGSASNLQYSLDNGANWLDYSVAITFSGSILVRTPLNNDGVYEGAETFTLTATPSVGLAVVGTATILDDGTGTVFNPDGSVDNSTPKDNDTPVVSVISVTVSEASPYAVVEVSLSHASTSAISFTPALADGTGVVSTDTSGVLEYFNGSSWVSASSGVTIPAGGTSVLLRTGIINDSLYEGPETISITTGSITGTGVSSAAVGGVVNIVDDGSSTNVFNSNTNTVTPVVGAANDDRVISITSPSVNEASPYAVFTVTGHAGQTISLALANGTAIGAGTDYGTGGAGNLQYSLDNGGTWQDYSSPVTFTGTAVLVRTPLGNDNVYEGAETFTLTATPVSGSAVIGTATINDDGTGTVFNPDGSVNSSSPLDDDRPLTITSPSVNEASPYAVFTVTGNAGQTISLALANGTAIGGGTDYGTGGAGNLQYSLDNGGTWQDYSSPVTFTGTAVLVRTPLSNDNVYEGAETFTLTATPVSGSAVIGTATIHDDGTGTVFNPDGSVNSSTAKDNDTPVVSVSSVTVSEASPYAVVQASLSHASTSAISFTPTLVNGTGTVGVDTGSGLEYYNGSTWVSTASGVTIAAGSSTVLLRTSINNDTNYEGLETVAISTGAITGTGVSSAAVSGTVTIADDGSSTNVFNANTDSATPVPGVADNDIKTLISDTSIILADGFNNLLLNNVTKSATTNTATCLPDWLAKMSGNNHQAVKAVANLNGTGNSWDNALTGNNGNNKLSGLDGNDTIYGVKGNDVLIGGNGADTLYGGAGNDTFKYLAVTDSPSGDSLYDSIEDFQRGHDKIDLRSIDANDGRSGNQAFKLVSAFTNHAGQIHFDATSHRLEADTNGDGSADFAIEVIGVAKLTSADILL